MPLTMTIRFTIPVRNVTIYDHNGSDRPVLHEFTADEVDLPYEKELPPIHSTYCCCDGPQGVLEVKGEALIGGVWVMKDEQFLVHQGEIRQWP